MEQSENINELATALVKAQSEIEGAVKDSDNLYFKSKYADLFSVWKACREPLTKNGLCVVQTMGNDENEGATVITTLMHSSGQWIRGSLNMKPVKNDPQGIGSCITYNRRYSLAAIVGVCPEDDDGNIASHGKPSKPEKEKQKYKNFDFLKEMGVIKKELNELTGNDYLYAKTLGEKGYEHSDEIEPAKQKGALTYFKKLLEDTRESDGLKEVVT